MTDPHLPPPDPRQVDPALADAASRVARQRALSLASVPDEVFDAIARDVVRQTGATAAMVNLVGDGGQFFAGLHGRPADAGEPSFLGDPGRFMAMDQGFCVNVVGRKTALPLDDVFDSPRFSGNRVIDEIGVRSYLGSPLLDADGTVIGTVCAIDPAPRSKDAGTAWGLDGLAVVKRACTQVMAEIDRRRPIADLIGQTPGAVMVTGSPGLEVLYANAGHEQLFGTVPRLGAPAPEAFPGLDAVGILAAITAVHTTGRPAATGPVPQPDSASTIVFASVPARVPGHSAATLTLGLPDTGPQACTQRAEQLAVAIADLTGPA